jgi:hypothetical protein
MLHISVITEHPQALFNAWDLTNCVYIYVHFILGFKYHVFNPLNAELHPFCHLLALLAHHILHISRIRVNARGWSVRPKHVACADETNKIWCEWRYTIISSLQF